MIKFFQRKKKKKKSTDLGLRYHNIKYNFTITLSVTLLQRFLKHLVKTLHDNVFPMQ